MATTAAKPSAKVEAKQGPLAYPKNLPVLGQLSFPLWSDNDITALALWRAEKGYKAGQYPDKVGGSLFITQEQVDKIQKYLLEIFLPFALAQYADTNGKKGFDQAAIDELSTLITNEDWSEANLPVRELSEKDIKNLGDDTEFVAKLSFSGSGGNEITKKALGRDEEGDLEVIAIPSEAGDVDRLWWGARNWFRAAFNLNAYTRVIKKDVVVYGISAYTRAAYLRTDLPMTMGSNDDEAVLESDFED